MLALIPRPPNLWGRDVAQSWRNVAEEHTLISVCGDQHIFVALNREDGRIETSLDAEISCLIFRIFVILVFDGEEEFTDWRLVHCR